MHMLASSGSLRIHATTVVAARKDGKVAMGSDGQATIGHTVAKAQAKKVRYIYQDKVLVGFAGSAADGITLFERFEAKLEQYSGQVVRASVELAKDWRQDRYLRRLEAIMAVASADALLMVAGNGDVMEPDDDLIAIGSGGNYALAAGRAILEHAPDLSAHAIVESSLKIAADLCIYTNHHRTIYDLPRPR
jgi:ATP-dependent HslUV protease subunit HslV